MSQHVRDISETEFPQAVLQRSQEVPVVIDFWAEWCGPCKTLSPVLEKVAEEMDGAFELVKINVDENQTLAAQFGVQSIPFVMAFRNGAPVSQFAGAIPESAFREWVGGVLPSPADRAVDEARDAVLAGDVVRAEALFRAVLDESSDHQDAGTGLASLLLARGETEEALIVLGKLAASPDVERLQAAARLTASQGTDVADLESRLAAAPDDEAIRLDLAKALAAKAEFEPALDHLLAVVRAKGERFDDARTSMLDIFGVLGDEHPLTVTYRRQLSNALF